MLWKGAVFGEFAYVAINLVKSIREFCIYSFVHYGHLWRRGSINGPKVGIKGNKEYILNRTNWYQKGYFGQDSWIATKVSRRLNKDLKAQRFS